MLSNQALVALLTNKSKSRSIGDYHIEKGVLLNSDLSGNTWSSCSKFSALLAATWCTAMAHTKIEVHTLTQAYHFGLDCPIEVDRGYQARTCTFAIFKMDGVTRRPVLFFDVDNCVSSL